MSDPTVTPERPDDCRHCGCSNVGCWSINAFNGQDCCGRCDHVSEVADAN